MGVIRGRRVGCWRGRRSQCVVCDAGVRSLADDGADHC